MPWEALNKPILDLSEHAKQKSIYSRKFNDLYSLILAIHPFIA